MSNIEKKKSEIELFDAFYGDSNNDTMRCQIGDVLHYSSNGSELYRIIGINEDEYGVYLEVVSLDGNGDDKTIRKSSIGYYSNLGKDFDLDSFQSDVEGILHGKLSIDDIGERLESTNSSNSTDLMVLNKNILTIKKDHLVMVHRYVKAVSDRAKAELQSKLSGLNMMLDGYKKTISKINKLIFTIELYEGLTEEIHQIKVGMASSPSEPVSLRQKKLFMDEEVGDPSDDGLDFKNIEDFDKWLLERNTYWNCFNYEFIVPEEKCVVPLGIRRSEKNYSVNPFLNMLINQNNDWCYLLIRNGENIYRIFSDLKIGNKLFPEQDELLKLQIEYDETKWDSDKDKIDDKIDRYKFNMILLQGIIERTECFPDEKHTLSLFKMNENSNVKFIYDADRSKLLPSDIPPYSAWVKSKNVDTGVGSQILWFSSSVGYKAEIDRMFREYHRSDYGYPKNPSTGLYQLEGTKYKSFWEDNEKDILFFKYDPDRYKWYYDDENKPRVKRVSFIFYLQDDNFINYDNITRKDLVTLEYYLYTRIGRSEYLSVIPQLLEILKRKKEEFQKEDDFIRLTLINAGLNPESDFEKGVEGMQWWKTKNKWKRTLSTDDAKALRMITKYLKTNG